MSDIRTVELTGAELAVEDICGSNVCVKNYAVKGSYISEVPASGKIYANIGSGHCVVYTSDSYPAIVEAVIARREGRL